ncbi:AUGMIN subunit 3 isoform X6 [Triticum aestivum]|uniref:AUGMIN subunit 3 isoform X6 n=1 Tax=Triticum aestivum TaxID=4565 RepID=UPI001D02CF08|nr:AUGMIN subunit 3-like isoform X6 [Triticum aestivum]
MSAKQLCDALAAAGFDSGDPLDPESLDWAFLQGDDSSRVLAWIAARLRRANVLSASDLELYDQLELEGKLLEGKDLDSAFDSISVFSEIGENHEYTFLSEESLGDIRNSLQYYNRRICYVTGALRFVAKEDMPRGDSKKPHHFVVELKRINSVFAKSKKQYIEAQMEHANEEATLSKLRAQLASQHSYIHEDIHSLRRRNSELTEELKVLSLQVQECLSETVASLCSDLARLEGANILQGDHNLIVHRQECYISQQKRFINHLVNQLAAHRFLAIACQLERRTKISSAYSLLKATEMELQSYVLAVNSRLVLDQYHLIGEAASSMIEEGSIDDRDTFLHAVRDILSSYSGSQTMTPTYVSACALVEQISELEDELHCYQHELENVLPRERGRFIDEQCRMVQTLEQILSVPVTHMLPKFTPWPLAQALEELEMISYEVSASVNEVTMAREEKTKMLQQPSRNAQQERRLFADFFCHPGRLENQVRELTSRVRGIPE